MGRQYQTQQRSWALSVGIVLVLLMPGCGEVASPSLETRSATPSIDSSAEPSVSGEATKNAASAPLTEPELWARLQQATDQTYAVMFRHAIAPGGGDPPGFVLEDCSTQRNLSDEGRQQATHIGDTFRDRNISVTQVLSSQWCRCLETAKLLNLGEVQPFPALNSFFSDRSRAARQTNQIRQFLLENQNKPGVIVLVSHQVNITALSDIVPQSGEAIVMQVTSDQITVLGQLQP